MWFTCHHLWLTESWKYKIFRPVRLRLAIQALKGRTFIAQSNALGAIICTVLALKGRSRMNIFGNCR